MRQIEKVLLPIDKYIPEILNSLQDYSTVLVKASPGSGKTTRLPWEIAARLSLRVAVLEPRKLAAKLAALRIAEEENLEIGKEVGYHFRYEREATDSTRLTFYTEGTFLKKFISDPELKNIDVVILDEFHERHLDTDLALSLLRSLQEKRPDLKIILMSATLDSKLQETMPEARSFEIEARLHPVEISYLPNQPSVLNQSLETKVRRAIESLPDIHGDVLVFLPGMREMLRTQEALNDENVFLLHGDLNREEQEAALGKSSKRKIILATNIAESSVTIPGITVVIDSGIQREAHYSAWNGLKFIEDHPVTKSSAIQRAGRAGRTAPGLCVRLYSEQDFNQRSEHTIPEIFRADLTDMTLLISQAKMTPRWFDHPPKEKMERALELLERMGAVESGGAVTSTGRRMLEYPLEARLARILIAGEGLKKAERTKLLHFICEEIEGDATGRLRGRLHSYLKSEGDLDRPWESCLLHGFVDQVAMLRSKQRDFIHFSGKTLKAHSSLASLHEKFYIILDITRKQEAIKVVPVEETWLWELEPFPLKEEDEISIDEKVLIKKKTKLGSIVLEETVQKSSWSELSSASKKQIEVASRTLFKNKIENWKNAEAFGRYHFFSRMKGLDLEALLEELSPRMYFAMSEKLDWELLPYFLKQMIEEKLDIHDLERSLPQSIGLGGRRELTLHYPVNMDPYLEAPIQDFYGTKETPRIMNGTVEVTLKLLGPHKRPIQVTKDLKNFWLKTYPEMKREYQRDYPRHHWPDNPGEAKPILLKSQLPKP